MFAALRMTTPQTPDTDMCARCPLLLQENGLGRIRRSRCCGKMKVEVGNVLITMTEAGFDRFVEFVEELSPETIERSGSGLGDRRRLAIELHPTGLCVTVDRRELGQLKELLLGARSYLELGREITESIMPAN
jgi:hypothetical protein